MSTTLDFEEELVLQEGGWRARAITFGVILLVAAFVAAGIWYFQFRDEEVAARATEDVAVKKATINSTLIISGTADAQLNSDLNFQSSGRVSAVNVKVGDVVTQGQVLASLESDDLSNAVASAQAGVVTADLRLQDLLEGSTPAEIAAAEQGVATAESTLAKAQNDLADLRDGPSAADTATAEQAVQLAESQLANAESALQALEDAPSAADLAAAEAGVAASQSALTAAQNSAASADNTLDSARASLISAQTSYCAADAAPAFCSAAAAPASSADLALLNAALSGANATLAAAAIAANNTYLNAVNAAASADAAVASAQDALDSAEAKLDAVEEGASDGDVAAAEAAVASAESQLASAQARLDDLNDGADPADIVAAEAAVAAAEAGLDSADAKLADAHRGPEANAILQARQAVRTAQLSVEAAQIRLKNSQIVAPFNGTVASVNITPGEFASAAGQTAAIVMLTPEAIVLKIDVSETDYPNIKAGQGGAALFDGLPGRVYPFSITEIGLAPTVTQGVVTFEVTAAVVVLGDNPRPAPGMNARGQLTTGSRPDVLVVPPRAIRRRGSEQIVDVRRGDVIEEVVVTTGLSDTENVEILTGLTEGDTIVVPAISTAGGVPAGGPTPVPTLPGGLR